MEPRLEIRNDIIAAPLPGPHGNRRVPQRPDEDAAVRPDNFGTYIVAVRRIAACFRITRRPESNSI